MDKKRQPCKIFSRCCGWYVEKESGNPGKQSEYSDRLEYSPSKFSK